MRDPAGLEGQDVPSSTSQIPDAAVSTAMQQLGELPARPQLAAACAGGSTRVPSAWRRVRGGLSVPGKYLCCSDTDSVCLAP